MPRLTPGAPVAAPAAPSGPRPRWRPRLRRGRDPAHVPEPAAATAAVRLEIDLESEPITGRVTDASGCGVPFRGWIELATALEAAHSSSGAS